MWDQEIAGWRPYREAMPAWWGGEEVLEGTMEAPAVAAAPATVTVSAAERRASKSKPEAQPSLFAEADELVADAVAAPGAPAVTTPSWVAAVLESEVFASQRALAGRLAPADDVVRTILMTLDRYRGRAPRAVLAGALGQPEIRLRGILAGVQRLLNVDGYQVLVVDEGTGVVEVQMELLRRQFGVEK
jgi:hypothetical protein